MLDDTTKGRVITFLGENLKGALQKRARENDRTLTAEIRRRLWRSLREEKNPESREMDLGLKTA